MRYLAKETYWSDVDISFLFTRALNMSEVAYLPETNWKNGRKPCPLDRKFKLVGALTGDVKNSFYYIFKPSLYTVTIHQWWSKLTGLGSALEKAQ